MNTPQIKFQQLLRELFQFDCADLDFGIYRIINLKRAVIEHFISKDLPRLVNDELNKGALAAQSQAAQELQAARQKVLEALGEDAIDAEGNLAEKYRETKAGREYLAAQERARSAKGREALEADIYNHLYAFFSRYWQDGDFISKRRYSKKERYAIPYNGEEVYLYWANHDQYYVKTGEYFTDYTLKAPNGVVVYFKLKAADVEQNNVKGEKRFFLPRLSEIVWDAEVRALTIPFEFRPLTEQEQITYGKKNQQEAIIAETLGEVPKRLPKNTPEALGALIAEKRRADGTAVTLLEHHLRQYTRRNTSDFFIHKDLKGFLSRELDFYLKNEVLNLEEMEAAGDGLAEGWFQLLRLIKRIGLIIIEFLAQIEDFQKMLWEKKKFVTETFYVVTVGNIPEDFYPEIAENEAQWAEWKDLLHIEEDQQNLFIAGKHKKEKRIEFLKSHPSLPLDTRHFPPDFTDQLLASYENLDEITDGLLIHSENWQALNLLQEKYRERVKCVYIDPPYNTEKDRADGKFLYKDGYAFSTWLAMIDGRLQVTWPLLCETGGFYVSIDDTMYADLFALLASVFGRENHIATVIWEKVHTRKNSARHFSVSHDYIPCFARDKNAWDRVLIPRENTDAYSNPDNDPRGAWKADPVYANNPYDADYTITKPNGVVLRRPPGQYWRFSEATWLEFVRRGTVIWGEGNSYPLVKRYLRDVQDGLVPVTLFKRDFAGDNAAANAEFDALFGSERLFSYPKPARLIERLCQTNVRPGAGEIVLDHFAGSGTTGHAVINLNREDGGRRKFILVEMARYFDTVLLPRIKKVTFSPEWKDGKPKRTASQEEFERGPRIVKVIRLESYEDALNNLSFDEDGAQIAMQFEDYLLRYLLQWETRKSETLLNVEKLSKPFDYCLHIHRDGEIRVQKVDLPETFAYLIGLDVAKRQVLDNDGRRYLVYRGTTREGKRTAVIWRKTEGWTENDYRRDRDFVAKHKLAEGADLIYTNGDSLIPGAQALDGVFKAKMFTSVEG